VAPVISPWTLAPDDLAHRPGYRSDSAGRAEDIRNAKQLWSAAFGDTPTAPLRVLFAGVPKVIPDRGIDALRRQLRDVLNVEMVDATDVTGSALIASTLLRNLAGATEGVATFTFGLEDGGVDLD